MRASGLTRFASVLAVAYMATACGSEPSAPALPALKIDTSRVAVAGLSSGAYMATQVHFALNDRIQGAALYSGGPYGCAQANLDMALGPCMKAEPSAPDLLGLVAKTKERADAGKISPINALQGDRVFVFHGAKDGTVNPALGKLSAGLYRQLGGESLPVTLDDQRPVGHTFPTLATGSDCEVTESPFLGNCGIDGAGLGIQALFGNLGAAGTAPSGRLLSFDQASLFGEGDDAGKGLAESGFTYVPKACDAGGCGALVVFHGCQQNAENVGESFVRDAGFNRWADLYQLVVVYPQTRSSYVPLNPKACWDWWGYSGTNYDTREGAQARFVANLLDRLAASP
jgi:poly(3-hydroxybutyrate) depolymerase